MSEARDFKPTVRQVVFDFVPAPIKTKQPDGAVLSPVTEPMYAAFWSAFEEAYKHRGHRESTSAAYNAMMAAAPRNIEEMADQWSGRSWHPKVVK